MSLLFALIDKALGDSLGVCLEVADTALNVATGKTYRNYKNYI